MNALPRLPSHLNLGHLREHFWSALPVAAGLCMAVSGMILFPHRQLGLSAQLVQDCIVSMTIIGWLKVVIGLMVGAFSDIRAAAVTAGARILLLGLTAHILAQVDTASYRSFYALVQDDPQELVAVAVGIVIALVISGRARRLVPEIISSGLSR